MMLFSIVLCTFNRADHIGRAIDAVLAQSFADFELIVVIDGSTDETAEVVATYDEPRIRAIERPNGGLSAARNTGIAAARGRLVVFLDDDDDVSADWLAGLAAGIDERTGFSACGARFVDEDRTVTREVPARSHVLYEHVRGVFLAGTFAIDRESLASIGGYAEDIRVSHQSELLLRALPELERRGLTPVLCDRPLIDIERRDPGHRPLSQPVDLLHGAEYLIEHHGPLLASRPHALANYHAIAGVNAAQIGDRRKARHHLYRAARTHPRDRRHLGRLAVALVPSLARRTWGSAS